MSLSATVLGGLIDGNLAAQGAQGSNRTNFSNAVARGIVMSIVGKSFTTNDVGLTPGTGNGTGTGITGLSYSTMTTTALSVMTSHGSNAQNLLDAINSAVVTHLSSSASLNSTNAPVYSGTGTIVVGSIAVSVSEMTNNIDNQLIADGAVGSNRGNFSLALATGIVNDIISAGSGTLTITGSIITPPPMSGSGTGTGVVT